MIDKKRAIKYCKDDISLIENYDKAIADDTQTWHCHHRRETIYSAKELIEICEYYNRPACELIFLTKTEHTRLHQLGKHHSEETRKKISESNKGENNPMFGKHHSAETRKKLSESLKGGTFSEETRKKLSEAHKGKQFSDETRKKISESNKGEKNPFFGKNHSAEARKKMSESHIGKHYPKLSEAKKGLHLHWYNNGVKSILAKTCPEGFVLGRLK